VIGVERRPTPGSATPGARSVSAADELSLQLARELQRQFDAEAESAHRAQLEHEDQSFEDWVSRELVCCVCDKSVRNMLSPGRRNTRGKRPRGEPDIASALLDVLPDTVSLECGHFACEACLEGAVREQVRKRLATISRAECPRRDCREVISAALVRRVIPAEEYDRLLEEELKPASEHLVSCPNCHARFEHVAGTADDERGLVIRDPQGKPLRSAMLEHRRQFRLRCASCGKDFCSACSRSPYHLGRSCADQALLEATPRCRFCDAAVPSAAPGSSVVVCSDPTCKEYSLSLCNKTLSCGHHCCGTRGEAKCPPCLERDCPSMAAASSSSLAAPVNGDEFCPICYVDCLRAAPVMKLECGHIFHEHCIRKRIQSKWKGSRISFKFLECPTCTKPLRHNLLAKELEPFEKLKSLICDRALAQLAIEGLDKDPALCKDATSPFYRKPLEFALHKFQFFQCFKCSKPYFGGLQECAAGDAADFDPKELVCGACAAPACGAKTCPVHGSDYLIRKCRYCCSHATWFCFGTTSFCNPCHERHCKGDYLTKKKVSDFKQCGGKDKCPLKVDHPPNGTNAEFFLGCALCQSKSSGLVMDATAEKRSKGCRAQ
jgi:hypothetical protein